MFVDGRLLTASGLDRELWASRWQCAFRSAEGYFAEESNLRNELQTSNDMCVIDFGTLRKLESWNALHASAGTPAVSVQIFRFSGASCSVNALLFAVYWI